MNTTDQRYHQACLATVTKHMDPATLIAIALAECERRATIAADQDRRWTQHEWGRAARALEIALRTFGSSPPRIETNETCTDSTPSPTP